MMIAGMLKACKEVTTDIGVTGDSSRTSRIKYITMNRRPAREATCRCNNVKLNDSSHVEARFRHKNKQTKRYPFS